MRKLIAKRRSGIFTQT